MSDTESQDGAPAPSGGAPAKEAEGAGAPAGNVPPTSGGDGSNQDGGAGDDPYVALALPEKTALGGDFLEAMRTLAKQHNIPVDAAKALVETVHGEVTDIVGTLTETSKPDGALWKERVAKDRADSLAAPDLGNNDPVKLDTIRLRAELYLNTRAPALKEILHKEGLLAHPDVLRYLDAQVRERGEASFVQGNLAPPPARAPSLRDRYNDDGSPKAGVSAVVT